MHKHRGNSPWSYDIVPSDPLCKDLTKPVQNHGVRRQITHKDGKIV